MSVKRRFIRLIYLFLGILLVYYVALLMRQPNLEETVSCYFEPNLVDGFPGFNSTAEHVRLSSGRNIFFLETGCSRFTKLNCRQACAVESAAFMNPNMTVNLLFLNSAPPSNSTLRLVERLHTYENVRIRRVNVQEYVKNTPLEHWLTKDIISSSKWPVSHTSDILRFLTLWKYGGIYLDLDTVDTTNLEDLENFVGAEDEDNLNPAIIGFSAKGVGHYIANTCLNELMRNFNGKIWGNNGPGVITRVLKDICNVDKFEDMTAERCLGFQVFPSDVFHPIHFSKWKNYFTVTDANETMRRIDKAKLIHVWNALSKSTPVQIGGKVPYDLIAKKYCSRVYHSCGTTF